MNLAIVRNAAWLARGSFIAWNVRTHLDKSTHIDLGRRCRMQGPGLLTMLNGAALIMGDNSRFVGFFDVVVDRDASLIVGKNVYLGAFMNIRCNRKIYIGNHTQLGQFVSLVGGNYQIPGRAGTISEENFEAREVIIGDNAWIGAGVTVLPGRMVGDGAVVGAGSVVTRDVKPYEIVAGSPVKNLGWR